MAQEVNHKNFRAAKGEDDTVNLQLHSHVIRT